MHKKIQTNYPKEPWYLGGSLQASLFLLPASLLPVNFVIPEGRRPLRLGNRIIVGVTAVRYVEGGALEYDELLVALPSFGRGGIRITIPQIWVDSPQSQRGGRELWGIPKQLASFQQTTNKSVTRVAISANNQPLATLQAHRGRKLLPGMWQFSLPILQTLHKQITLSYNRVISQVSWLKARWSFDPQGELHYLHNQKPFISVSLHDGSIIFGMNVKRKPEGNK